MHGVPQTKQWCLALRRNRCKRPTEVAETMSKNVPWASRRKYYDIQSGYQGKDDVLLIGSPILKWSVIFIDICSSPQIVNVHLDPSIMRPYLYALSAALYLDFATTCYIDTVTLNYLFCAITNVIHSTLWILYECVFRWADFLSYLLIRYMIRKLYF